MENLINLRIELPQEVINKLESIIVTTVARTLQEHMNCIQAEPKMFTRNEAAKALRITLPTLRAYELDGRLVPKRAGKRVLYGKQEIDLFLASFH